VQFHNANQRIINDILRHVRFDVSKQVNTRLSLKAFASPHS